jgi:uncharacterized membrane protein
VTDTTGALPRESFRGTAVIAYLLFLIGWPCLHLTTIAGLVLAYTQRADSRGTIWESHFSNIIETFWITLVIGVLLTPLYFVGIGFLILGGVIVWFLYRMVKGLIRAIDGRPYR